MAQSGADRTHPHIYGIHVVYIPTCYIHGREHAHWRRTQAATARRRHRSRFTYTSIYEPIYAIYYTFKHGMYCECVRRHVDNDDYRKSQGYAYIDEHSQNPNNTTTKPP